MLHASTSLPTGERGLKSVALALSCSLLGVAPHGGAWIEIQNCQIRFSGLVVAPHGGAWIEIVVLLNLYVWHSVAPHGGAWIEIWDFDCDGDAYIVAPHGGAWIEMHIRMILVLFCIVAPHGGAWIEILVDCIASAIFWRRSPRGSVD